MEKTSLQKRFRFVMIIAALASFLTIVTPAYIRYGSDKKGWPRVVMMWTVIFGKGAKNQFGFSWFAFFGYIAIFVLLIVCLLRRFITIDTTTDGKKEKKKSNAGSIILDSVCLVLCLLALVMFILLPILITATSCTNDYLIDRHYGWGFSYIIMYICLAVMIFSSFVSLYAESIVKFMTMREKKVKVTKAEDTVKVETKEEKKETVETKEETTEENKEEKE